MQKSQGAEATVICSSLRAMDGAAAGHRHFRNQAPFASDTG